MDLKWNLWQEYTFNAGVPQDSIFDLILFRLYLNDLPNDMICNVVICADDTTLHPKCN